MVDEIRVINAVAVAESHYEHAQSLTAEYLTNIIDAVALYEGVGMELPEGLKTEAEAQTLVSQVLSESTSYNNATGVGCALYYTRYWGTQSWMSSRVYSSAHRHYHTTYATYEPYVVYCQNYARTILIRENNFRAIHAEAALAVLDAEITTFSEYRKKVNAAVADAELSAAKARQSVEITLAAAKSARDAEPVALTNAEIAAFAERNKARDKAILDVADDAKNAEYAATIAAMEAAKIDDSLVSAQAAKVEAESALTIIVSHNALGVSTVISSVTADGIKDALAEELQTANDAVEVAQTAVDNALIARNDAYESEVDGEELAAIEALSVANEALATVVAVLEVAQTVFNAQETEIESIERKGAAAQEARVARKLFIIQVYEAQDAATLAAEEAEVHIGIAARTQAGVTLIKREYARLSADRKTIEKTFPFHGLESYVFPDRTSTGSLGKFNNEMLVDKGIYPIDEIDVEINPHTHKIDEYINIITDDRVVRSSKIIELTEEQKSEAFVIAMQEIRVKRDQLMRETDYIEQSSHISDINKAKTRVYRAILLDTPQKLTTIKEIEEFEFPILVFGTVVTDGTVQNYRGCMVIRTTDSTRYTTPAYISWQAESYDTSNIYRGGTRLYVPSGVTKVRLSASVAARDSVDGREITADIKKNGGDYSGRTKSGSDMVSAINITTPVLLVRSGDYFEVNTFISSSSFVLKASNMTWFAMEIIE